MLDWCQVDDTAIGVAYSENPSLTLQPQFEDSQDFLQSNTAHYPAPPAHTHAQYWVLLVSALESHVQHPESTCHITLLYTQSVVVSNSDGSELVSVCRLVMLSLARPLAQVEERCLTLGGLQPVRAFRELAKAGLSGQDALVGLWRQR
jgi:hypothetical protein